MLCDILPNVSNVVALVGCGSEVDEIRYRTLHDIISGNPHLAALTFLV